MDRTGQRRKVLPWWWPPTLLIRQASSAVLLGALTRWRQFPKWMVRYGFRCLPGAAGAIGMGCIGFPNHPVWEITTACNLRCIHCHVAGNATHKPELNTVEGKRLLSQLAEVRNFRMMAFTGGEPLMRPDFFELLDYAKDLGFSNTIATNATMVDDSVARRLKKSGVVIAAVSLDGCDAATHDAVRGVPGSFDAALGGIRALDSAGILLHINITAMEYNLHQMEELVGLIEKLNTAILLMYQLVPVGRGKVIEGASLNAEAHERLIRFMGEAQKRSGAVIEPVAAPQYWALLLQRAGIRGGVPLRIAGSLFHGCAAGRGFVYIKPDGQVWPCPFIEKACGNIRLTPFPDIWRDSPVLRELRERESRLQGKCGKCEYRSVCGGCRGRALARTGDLFGEDSSCFLETGGGVRG